MVKSIFCLVTESDPNSSKMMETHIHDIVENNECSAFGLLFISYSYLPYATIASKKIIQVFTGDLVVQVFHEQNAVRSWGQFRLALKIVQRVILLASVKKNCTAGLASAMQELGVGSQENCLDLLDTNLVVFGLIILLRLRRCSSASQYSLSP